MSNYSAIAFDYGLRNIGVAIGQSLTQSASELPAMKARDGVPNWQEVQKLLKEWQPRKVVLGLPLNMDGSESEMSKRARKFGQRLHGRFGCDIAFVDERLSSHEAKGIARAEGHKGDYGDHPIDSLAATIILKSWWQQD